MSAMTSPQEEFIQEIIARPGDDTPRLVYADWLEERGDPQGEFIRLQCELAQPESGSERTQELRQRQRELLTAHRTEWVRSVSGGIRWSEFRRGLLEEVVIDGRSFVEEGGQALRRAPILELGTSLFSKEQIAAFVNMPELRQLRKLRLGSSSLGDNGIRQLVQSPHFPPLKVLWLSHCDLGLEGLMVLSDCAALAGLETLVLTGNLLADLGVQVLADSSTFASLRRLPGGSQLIWSRSPEPTPHRAPIVREEPSRTQDVPRPSPPRMSVEEILRAARAYRPPATE